MMSQKPKFPTASEFVNDLEFDFIIIGGGTAGLSLASRLSEEPSFRVGVIEAGDYLPDEPRINIPGLFSQSFGDPALDSGIVSVPQQINGNPVYVPQGSVLGGTSSINFMGSTRASDVEYDGWESMGNKGWNATSITEAIQKSESVSDELRHPSKNPRYGTTGPIKKSLPAWKSDIQEPWMDALEEFGVKKNLDPGNGDNIGSSSCILTVDSTTVTRSYATSGYFEPVAHRSNLTVLLRARATKIILTQDQGTVTATGVEFTKDGITCIVKAQKEVILSAGVFRTPQILELSGIGDPSILNNFQLPVGVPLPGVGQNLQEHPAATNIFEVDSSLATLDLLTNPEYAAEQMDLYKRKRQGIFAAVAGVFSFLPLQMFTSAEERKELKEKLGKIEGNSRRLKLTKEWFDDERVAHVEIIVIPGVLPYKGFSPAPEKHHMTVITGLMHPFSSGSTHITSPIPTVQPKIDFNLLSYEVEVDVMALATKFIKKVCEESKKLAEIGGVKAAHGEGEELLDVMKKTVSTCKHPVGTAAMLPRESGGVVDNELKVYGTSNLRVVDASIFPIQLACHSSATVYAVAEKASDIIKNVYK